VIAAFAAALAATLVVMTVVLGIRLLGTRQAASSWSRAVPFLGGHEPDTHAWSRFHARWYPMAIVLIAFEMEMMFMYPWAVVFVEEGITALVEMGVFLLILGLGILYAWREGVFAWQ
jgi:NADH:ubiquinone oxidoreductase subunit 3 (subunit A)